MMNQWPTLEGVFSVDGYDQMVSDSPAVRQMVENVRRFGGRALYEYGVQAILKYRDPEESGRIGRDPSSGVPPANGSGTVFAIVHPRARPMSFFERTPDVGLPVKFDGGGATITTPGMSEAGTLVLNMLWRDEIHCRANGQNVASRPDSWGRIRAVVPPGTTSLRVDFQPQWGLGWMAAGFSLAGAVVLKWLSREAA